VGIITGLIDNGHEPANHRGEGLISKKEASENE
jgi:hypothetical protein